MNPLLYPIWEGSAVIGESVLPLADGDGSVAPIPLMYPADEILSVTSATQEMTFEQGKDYDLADGNLVILPGGGVPVMAYDDYYPSCDDGKTFPRTGGGFIRFSEGSYMHAKQIAVSYRHRGVWPAPVPRDKSCLLPKTIKRLSEGGSTRLLIYGDSISTGANASGFTGAAPFQKSWFGLVHEALCERYGQGAVAMDNTAVGGTTSDWGAKNAKERGADLAPDLCVVAFGMNDGSGKVPPETYIANTRAIMDTIRTASPDCEFIVVATSVANDEVAGFAGFQDDYLQPLLALEKEGVAVADMTTIHRALLSRKAFRDMSGNNVNHPNDFLSRVMAQLILRTMGVI